MSEIVNPKAADDADMALEQVGANLLRGATPDDVVCALEYFLATRAPDAYAAAEDTAHAGYVLETIQHILGAKRRPC